LETSIKPLIYRRVLRVPRGRKEFAERKGNLGKEQPGGTLAVAKKEKKTSTASELMIPGWKKRVAAGGS